MQLDPSHPPGELMLSILRILLQCVLATGDSHETCELVHHDTNSVRTYPMIPDALSPARMP